MIYGHIGSELCRGVYNRKLLKAIDYCKIADAALMHEGRYAMDGEDEREYVVQICERRTGKRREKRPEVHRIYAELQYVLSGREYIGFYPDLGNNEVESDQLVEKDTLYYRENPHSPEQMLAMTKGCYAVFFPEDVHRPFCSMGKGEEEEEIKKIVVKIRL